MAFFQGGQQPRWLASLGVLSMNVTYEGRRCPNKNRPNTKQLWSSTDDSAPSEARKRGSGGGSPVKYDDLLTGSSDLDVNNPKGPSEASPGGGGVWVWGFPPRKREPLRPRAKAYK
jgi:hypothetical protein